MIKEIIKEVEISGENSPLLPRIFSAFKYKTGSDNAWKQENGNGDTTTLLSSVDGNFTLISTPETDFEEIKEFVRFMGCNSIVSNVKLKENATHTYSLFKFVGEENEKTAERFLVFNSASSISAYRDLHTMLFYGQNNDFDNWYCDFSKKIVNGDAKSVVLTNGQNFLSVATAPMIFKNIAIVSGVFTLNSFRNRGYSKASIYKLIEELKKDDVTEIYLWCEKTLEEFYTKLGFVKTGDIYLETEF